MDTGSQVAPVYLVREFPFFPLHLEGKVPASGWYVSTCPPTAKGGSSETSAVAISDLRWFMNLKKSS